MMANPRNRTITMRERRLNVKLAEEAFLAASFELWECWDNLSKRVDYDATLDRFTAAGKALKEARDALCK